jgi:hypothetical protein
MSLRDYEGWRRYAKWKRENRDAWERSVKKQEQMSDGKTEALNGTYFSHKKVPTVKHIEQMPDQKWHRRISFLKSGIRIVGYVFIPFNLITATILLVISEVVGIFEELV